MKQEVIKPEPQRFLLAQLDERQAVNPKYSLRAFARDLSLSPQQLSNMLNGRRTITVSMALRISDQLKLDPETHLWFIESVRAKYSKSPEVRKAAKARLQEIQKSRKTVSNLSLDLFKLIANWHHLALVEMIRVDGTQPISRLAQKLNISENEAKLALGRLERLELIQKARFGYQVRQDTVISDRGVPTEAVKSFHSQILKKALQALEEQTEQTRYGSSSVIAVRAQDIELVKERMREFRLKLAQELAQKAPADAVFALSMQWFQVSDQKVVPKIEKQEGVSL